jgi:tRNA 2-thiouridine synthesizing protein A
VQYSVVRLLGAVRSSESATVVLDASGLNCPMPLLKAKKALNEMTAGALLRVIATDPGSVRDFEVFSRQSGNALLESKQTDGRFEYLLRKKG